MFYLFTQSTLYFSVFSIICLICISFDFALIFITSCLLPLVSLVYFSSSCFLSHGVVSFKLFFLMWIFVAINPTFRTVLAVSHISHIVHQYLFQCLFHLSMDSRFISCCVLHGFRDDRNWDDKGMNQGQTNRHKHGQLGCVYSDGVVPTTQQPECEHVQKK